MDKNSALEGIKVVDFGVGMAAALVAQFLGAAGAQVHRVEPQSGDPFGDVYPAYGVWRRSETVEPKAPSPERLRALLEAADVCITGGEDFPGMGRGLSAAFLAEFNPRLVVLDIAGYPEGVDKQDHHAVEILVQARSGLVFEHYSDRPFYMAFEPATYGAALQGTLGILAALYERERSGLGQIVSTSLFEGALTYGSYLWLNAERPCHATANVIPMDPAPLIFKCADGKYVHIVLGSAGSRARLYNVFGMDASGIDPEDNGLARLGAPPREFFGNPDLFEAHASRINRDELLAALWAAGLSADAILEPGECWDDPQIIQNGTVETDSDGRRYLGIPIAIQWSPGSRTAQTGSGAGPLSGVTVADLGAFIAGPYAGALLRDLGAEVIKVEPPAGDPNRSSYPSFTAGSRGKRSLAIDMKSEAGRDALYRLARKADVVANNFRTGVSKRLGVDAETLQHIAPGLIVLESSAFGPVGPKSGNPGFDPIIQGFCGLEHKAGGAGNAPLWNRTTMVDYTGGLIGAIAILLALYHRAKTGQGAQMNTPLVNAGLYLASDVFQTADGVFHGLGPLNHAQTGRHPAECMYQTKDGWIAVAARDESSAQRFAARLDVAGQISAGFAKWGDDEYEIIGAAVRRRATAELIEDFRAHDVWVEECRRTAPQDWLADPELLRRGIVWQAEHPEFGRVRHFGPCLSFSRSQTEPGRPAPDLGAHSAEILAELGVGAEAIQNLLHGAANS